METGLRTACRAEVKKNPPAQRKLSKAVCGDLGPEHCQCNSLFNTQSLMVDRRVSVYSTLQYQGHTLGTYSPEHAGHNRTGMQITGHQLLNPSALPQTLDTFFKPKLILYPEGVLRVWGDGGDCCETTFIDDMDPANSTTTVTKYGLRPTDIKFLDLSMEDPKIHTHSNNVDDDDEFQELESADLFQEPLSTSAASSPSLCNVGLMVKPAPYSGLAEACNLPFCQYMEGIQLKFRCWPPSSAPASVPPPHSSRSVICFLISKLTLLQRRSLLLTGLFNK